MKHDFELFFGIWGHEGSEPMSYISTALTTYSPHSDNYPPLCRSLVEKFSSHLTRSYNVFFKEGGLRYVILGIDGMVVDNYGSFHKNIPISFENFLNGLMFVIIGGNKMWNGSGV